ncbi:MAG: ferric iron uptake transcriptional regulator, partial [Porticoccaceae bacterium]|nr:ferric iron uptake transcriptional regulator [Porticoccaceae bacterium]
ITRHNFDSGPAIYGLDKGDGHDHMVCTETGKVVEFHDHEIHKRQEQIARENGFQVIGHSLVLYVKPLKQD